MEPVNSCWTTMGLSQFKYMMKPMYTGQQDRAIPREMLQLHRCLSGGGFSKSIRVVLHLKAPFFFLYLKTIFEEKHSGTIKLVTKYPYCLPQLSPLIQRRQLNGMFGKTYIINGMARGVRALSTVLTAGTQLSPDFISYIVLFMQRQKAFHLLPASGNKETGHLSKENEWFQKVFISNCFCEM